MESLLVTNVAVLEVFFFLQMTLGVMLSPTRFQLKKLLKLTSKWARNKKKKNGNLVSINMPV